ncbi:MAG TPA: hypothetical protein PK787_05020 [Burkholderiaceae bacterium]|nr:hypothetical protein [Burkholderiaceae bacterium]
MRARDDHWWLLGVLVVVVAGFWPSLFRHLRAQDLPHTLHGFTATAWLVGLIGQSWLISRGERGWHRRVALAMVPMAVAMIVTSLPMMVAILRSGMASPGFHSPAPSAASILRLTSLKIGPPDAGSMKSCLSM